MNMATELSDEQYAAGEQMAEEIRNRTCYRCGKVWTIEELNPRWAGGHWYTRLPMDGCCQDSRCRPVDAEEV